MKSVQCLAFFAHEIVIQTLTRSSVYGEACDSMLLWMVSDTDFHLRAKQTHSYFIERKRSPFNNEDKLSRHMHFLTFLNNCLLYELLLIVTDFIYIYFLTIVISGDVLATNVMNMHPT